MLLEDKVAVVSGVGPGLGDAIAHALAREGAKLVLAARNSSYLEEVRRDIVLTGGTAIAVPTDISDLAACRELVERALTEYQQLDILVNNAYLPDRPDLFETADLDRWREVFEVNVFGTLQITQAVLPAMIARQRGSIIMINSMVVRKPLPTIGAYIASKGALLAGARSLAKELGVHGIRVNSVVPGWIWGPSVKAVLQVQATATGTSQEEQYALVAKDIALGKIPLPSECADAVVFFASDLSRAVTGQALDINGGDVFH